MNTTFALQSTIEIILALGFIWGVFNEPKLARFEKKLFSKIKGVSSTNNANSPQLTIVNKKAS